MLTKEEIKDLSVINSFKSTKAILADWMGIGALFALVILWPNVLTYVAAFLLIPRFQYGLAIMMHDGAHGRLYRSSKLNSYLGQILLGSALFFSMDSYRILHLKHHRIPLEPEDPDITLTGGYPLKKGKFIGKLLRDLVGISYFKFIGYFLFKPRRQKKQKTQTSLIKSPHRKLPLPVLLVGMVTVNGFMFAILYALGHPFYYLIFWVLPMMTVLQFYLRIRGVTEHAGYQPNDDQRLNTRTVLPGIGTLLFAPHYVNYHIEHHIYPSIPFFNLPKVHQLMKARNSLPPQNVFSSYRSVIQSVLV